MLETNKDFINPKNVIQITIEIFNYNRDLTQDDFQKLSELPILVKNGQLAPANECYLSNDYHPKQDLESLFASTEFHKIVSFIFRFRRNKKSLNIFTSCCYSQSYFKTILIFTFTFNSSFQNKSHNT